MVTTIDLQMVINTQYGGFSLSDLAWRKMVEYGYAGCRYDIPRNDPTLIKVVQELREAANGDTSKLEVVTYTLRLEIRSYDGLETPEDLHISYTSE